MKLQINQFHQISFFFDKAKPLSIAIVGNGPSALKFKLGDHIDSYDCVVRMNNFKLSEDFEPSLGKKTNIFMFNFWNDVNKTPKDLNKHGVKMIWSSIPYSQYRPKWINMLNQGKDFFPSFPIFLLSEFDYFRIHNSNYRFIQLLRYLVFKLGGLSALRKLIFIKNVDTVPSTGLVAIFFALKLKPKQILITGYDFFSCNSAHYFNPNSPIPKETHHDFASEPDILCKIIKQNHKTKFKIALCDQDLKNKFSVFNNVEILNH